MKAQFKIQKHKPGGATLTVKGDLTVQSSKEFKEQLIKLLATVGTGTAEFSLKEAMAIDVTAFQLMYSAMEVLKKNEKKISVIWPDSQSVNELISKSGIKQALQNINN